MPGDTVCAGDTLLFTATSVNGGAVPVYIWKNFTTPIGTGSLFNYVPNNGDIITCSLISNAPCPVPDTVESTAHTIMVIPIVTPSNIISTPLGDSVSFIGQSVTFNSSITFCGSSPTYQWYRNGVLIPGATNISYTTTVSDDDTFYNVANCNIPCATTSIDTSNDIVIHADYLLNTEISSITNQLNEISLYPNPTSKTIHIAGMISWTKFRLLSIAGVIIKEGILQKGLNDIEMDGCASGVYMIQLTTENGANRVIRIIKE